MGVIYSLVFLSVFKESTFMKNAQQVMPFHFLSSNPASHFTLPPALLLTAPTTDARRLNPYFFAAQIQIPIPNEYLGFGYKRFVFL